MQNFIVSKNKESIIYHKLCEDRIEKYIPLDLYIIRDVATYMQKHICLHIWTKNIGRLYHNYDGFLMICVINVCVEPILFSLNPI